VVIIYYQIMKRIRSTTELS